MRTRLLSIISITGVVLASCGGSGEGLDENGRPITGEQTPLVPELQSIQNNVFTPTCATCHSGSSAPLGFRLDAASAYSMLVNTPSVEVPALRRVLPGNPDQSYLIQKLEGHAAVGAQMPLGQPPLPQATINVIRQWIADGAQQSVAGLQESVSESQQPEALQLRATMPLDGEMLTQPPREILLQASGELDITSLHSASISLRRSGGDGTFEDGNEVTLDGVTLNVRSLQPTVIALALPPEAWAPDTYELNLAGNHAPAVQGRDGVPIDGAELGMSGSDFILQFTVGAAQ
jgi:hypothetical protein